MKGGALVRRFVRGGAEPPRAPAEDHTTIVGLLDRSRATPNGRVVWRDVAAFTLLACVILRAFAALVLDAFFPRAPDVVIDVVDNHTPMLAAVLMLLFVSREGP
jgi:hypothetical protein